MDFVYNPEEQELFDEIYRSAQQQCMALLDGQSFEILTRFRRYNFSMRVFTSTGELDVHVKTFYYAVENGERKQADWIGPVLSRTMAIYDLIRKNNLDLPVPPVVVIDTDLGDNFCSHILPIRFLIDGESR